MGASMTKIGIIIGSTRPGRFADKPAQWFYEQTKECDASFELIDIRDYNLPLLDEDAPAKVSKQHTKKWSEAIAAMDGYVFVTAEHNHSFPASLKNAIDYLNKEWTYKPVAYVAYGFAAGHRAVEQLRPIAAQFHQYDLRETIHIQLDGSNELRVNESHEKSATELIKSIVFWAGVMKSARDRL
jgi:NAD(P)H-dependent FMN reductase